jgi:hypothetical protein
MREEELNLSAIIAMERRNDIIASLAELLLGTHHVAVFHDEQSATLIQY